MIYTNSGGLEVTIIGWNDHTQKARVRYHDGDEIDLRPSDLYADKGIYEIHLAILCAHADSLLANADVRKGRCRSCKRDARIVWNYDGQAGSPQCAECWCSAWRGAKGVYCDDITFLHVLIARAAERPS